ncbi:MAG: hypothetical protein ACK5LP_09465, partial [Campylobacteraceae bacterium]
MVCRAFLFLFFGFSFLLSAPLSYKELQNKPTSLAKDYYVYRLLTETDSLNETEAQTLFHTTRRMSPKLYEAFTKKIHSNETINNELRCKGLSAVHMVESNNDTCIMLRISPAIVLKLDSANKTKLIEILKENNPYTASWVEILNGED